jgi:hypothetical protein
MKSKRNSRGSRLSLGSERVKASYSQAPLLSTVRRAARWLSHERDVHLDYLNDVNLYTTRNFPHWLRNKYLQKTFDCMRWNVRFNGRSLDSEGVGDGASISNLLIITQLKPTYMVMPLYHKHVVVQPGVEQGGRDETTQGAANGVVMDGILSGHIKQMRTYNRHSSSQTMN